MKNKGEKFRKGTNPGRTISKYKKKQLVKHSGKKSNAKAYKRKYPELKNITIGEELIIGPI